jgi:hypothetical protein
MVCKFVPTMVAFVALALAPAVATADAIFYDRGLPTANLNNAAGANRSNVGWGYGASYPEWFTGDTFTLTGPSAQYSVTSLRAWFTVGNLGDGDLQSKLDGVTLYGGGAQTFAQLTSATFNGNATNSPNVSVTEVFYSNSQSYQGSSGSFIKLWQVDFTNLNWIVNAGQEYIFGVQGNNFKSTASGDGLFLHASNAGLSGSTQQGSDDQYRAMRFDGSPYSIAQTSFGYGWDKASDINVQINAAVVPLPLAAFAGMALFGLIAAKRRLCRSTDV